jgi:hypothetical protein
MKKDGGMIPVSSRMIFASEQLKPVKWVFSYLNSIIAPRRHPDMKGAM